MKFQLLPGSAGPGVDTASISKGNAIIDQHLPSISRGNNILATHMPHVAAGNAMMFQNSVTPRGPMSGVMPPTAIPIPYSPTSPLAQAIAVNAATNPGGVQITVWVGIMEQEGVSVDQIAAAYQCAGGDPVLSAAEQAGNTSSFLGTFVQCLQQQGVDSAIIAGSYQQAGGTL